jgi:hypothetical protein
VNTVNPQSLNDEKSGIHSCFSKMPDKLYELTTCSGRKIKATIDHPFLVNTGEGYVWKSLGKMVLTDKIIIRHSVKHLPRSKRFLRQLLLENRYSNDVSRV